MPRYTRVNPNEDMEQQVEQAFEAASQKQLARKAAMKSASKFAAKAGVKGGSKYIPLVGQAMMVAEGVPVWAKESKKTYAEAKKAGKEAYAQAKAGQYRQAGKKFVKGTLGMTKGQAIAGAKGLTAAFTSREVAELLPSRKNPMQYVTVRHNPESVYDRLLSLMMRQRDAYLFMHWNAKTYAEHLQYERLYQTLDEDIDTMAELAVSLVGSVHPVSVSVVDVERTEHAMQRIAQEMIEGLAGSTTPAQSDALENFLMTFIEKRQRVLYLLRLKG
jgi:DNA-binding ferritin-like protein